MSAFYDAVQAAYERSDEARIAGVTATVWESIVLALGGEDVTSILVDDSTPVGFSGDSATVVSFWALSEHGIASVGLIGVQSETSGYAVEAEGASISIRRLSDIVDLTQERESVVFPGSSSAEWQNPLFDRWSTPWTVSVRFADGETWQIHPSGDRFRSVIPALRQLFMFSR